MWIIETEYNYDPTGTIIQGLSQSAMDKLKVGAIKEQIILKPINDAVTQIAPLAFSGLARKQIEGGHDSMNQMWTVSHNLYENVIEIDLRGLPNLEVIGNNSFMSLGYKNNFQGIHIDGLRHLVEIEESAFFGVGIRGVNIRELSLCGCTSLRKVGTNAFMGYAHHSARMKRLNFTGCSSLEEIGEYAFSGIGHAAPSKVQVDLFPCTKLKTIGRNAFFDVGPDDPDEVERRFIAAERRRRIEQAAAENQKRAKNDEEIDIDNFLDVSNSKLV